MTEPEPYEITDEEATALAAAKAAFGIEHLGGKKKKRKTRKRKQKKRKTRKRKQKKRKTRNGRK